jgi:hypothetical protein
MHIHHVHNATCGGRDRCRAASVIHQSLILRCQQYIFQSHVNFMCTLDLEVFNFSEKMAWFAIYLALWTEFSTCQSTNLERRWLDLFCNYYHIQRVCDHFTALVVIFLLYSFILPHFWHIQNFIVNLNTMPLRKNKTTEFVLSSLSWFNHLCFTCVFR